jgi:hypothetical protein
MPLLMLPALLWHCQNTPAAIEVVLVPAAANSTVPNLSRSPQGEIFLTWVESAENNRHRLQFSRWQQNGWSSPHTIASGDNWFVNWADFPSLAAINSTALAAHWLVKSAASPYAYNVHIALSPDGGQNWQTSLQPHHDSTATEHGFVSLLPYGNHIWAFWLDGRNYANADTTTPLQQRGMTLRAALIDRNGHIRESALLDSLTCDCCQTDAAQTAEGVIIAYRDRSETEIRDIAVVRYENGQWAAPQTIHRDDWQINGCPVNGPAVAADSNRVVVVWFTEAQGNRRVQAAFSRDSGRSFAPPITLDDPDPLGRVDVALANDGSTWISYMSNDGDSAAIRLTRITPDGRQTTIHTVAHTPATRSAGFPHIAIKGQQLLIVWTHPGTPAQVQSAVLKLSNQAATAAFR